MTSKLYPILYKRDTTGGIRQWMMEQDEESYRTIAGIKDGTLVDSKWTTCVPKNVGRSNETSAIEQATAEIEATYEKKLKTGYFGDINEIDQVAFTKPMLAMDIDRRQGKWDFPVYAQPKLDGMRCIARDDGLWTRTGKPIVACEHIWEALAPIFKIWPDAVFDGELYNHDLKDDFNQLMSICRKQNPTDEQLALSADKIQYHVYDVPSSSEDFSKRDKIIDKMKLLVRSDCIQTVQTFFVHDQEYLDKLYASWIEDGYEGQMVRVDGPYEFKRSNNLMKRKDFLSDEFPVLRMEEGNGNWSGAVKRFIIQLPDGTEGEATPRGKYDGLAALLLTGNTPDWATIRYFGMTPAGKPRFPIAVDWGYGNRQD